LPAVRGGVSETGGAARRLGFDGAETTEGSDFVGDVAPAPSADSVLAASVALSVRSTGAGLAASAAAALADDVAGAGAAWAAAALAAGCGVSAFATVSAAAGSAEVASARGAVFPNQSRASAIPPFVASGKA